MKWVARIATFLFYLYIIGILIAAILHKNGIL